MTIHLNDIIDLDYLLSLDDQRDSAKEKEEILTRDREIFTQLEQGGQNPVDMDDNSLLFSWLEYRKLVFFHGAGEKTRAVLPGEVFTCLYSWLIYLLVATGFLSGISMAYSFLAYHGTRPVNVTIFFAVFIFFHLLLFILTLFMLARRFFMEKRGNKGWRNSIVHTLLSAFFFKGLPGLLKKINRRMGDKGMEMIEYTASLIRMKKREYSSIFFWPFFVLSSFFSGSFSLGALGGTLFRVAVSDMAFGWQSTLMTSTDDIHGGLSMISLPWSWFVPAAHPSPEQIEGSRIMLKEGIAALATKDLVSWWPFLCLGILFYAVLPRLILIMASFAAQRKALGQFDFEKPRFKKLMIRMQSPVMEIRFDEALVTRTGRQNAGPDTPGADPLESGRPGPEPVSPGLNRVDGAMILAPRSVCGGDMEAVTDFINQQLFFDVRLTLPIFFDYPEDKLLLVPLAKDSDDQVIVLQEVWQPPIRGLLYYFVQLKTKVFRDRPLWILLIQTPGEENQVVDGEDVNFKVWKKAIRELGNPDIILERVYK